MNKKRFRALGLAVLFALSAVFPVRQANAIVPLIGLTVAAIGPGGTLLSADLLVSGVTALLGGSIVALAITPSTADAPMRVPLASDQATIDAVMPPPAVASTSQQTSQRKWYGLGGTYSYNSAGESCSVGYAAQGDTTCQCDENSGYCQVFYMGNYSTGYVVLSQMTVTCPAGYTASGDSCLLTSAPRAVQPDQKYDVPVPVSGAGYVAPSASQEADAMPAYAAFSGGKVYAQGKNSSGQPVMIEYAKNADGSKTYITHYTQTETGSQTQVTTQSITVDSATGAVASAGVGTAVGSIAPATGAGAVPTVSTGAAVTSGTGSGSQSLVLPTDYARTGEAGAAATTINTKLDTLHRDLTEKGADIADPVAPEASAFSNAFFNGTFGNLLAWRLPAHTSECPTVTFDYMMFTSHQVHHMDAQCTIAEQIRPVLSVVMVVVWTVVALFVLLEA